MLNLFFLPKENAPDKTLELLLGNLEILGLIKVTASEKLFSSLKHFSMDENPQTTQICQNFSHQMQTLRYIFNKTIL